MRKRPMRQSVPGRWSLGHPASEKGIVLPNGQDDLHRPGDDSRPDAGALPAGSKRLTVGRFGRIGSR